MKLSRLFSSALVVMLAACSDATSTTSGDGLDHRAPPSVDLRASAADSGGVLRITVVASNPSRVHLQMISSPQCPFTVRIFPDSTGALVGGTGPGCPSSTGTTDLAPGDTVYLSRIFAANDLAQYAPGEYGINVTVGTTTDTTTVWGGAVTLPLNSRP